MASSARIVCIAIMGMDNTLLYMRREDGLDEYECHKVAFAALDVVEERAAASSKSTSANSRDCYLGTLYPLAEMKCYAHLTNSRVKILVMTSDANSRDQDLRGVLRRIYEEYQRLACGPFFTPTDPIKSRSFNDTMALVMNGM